jgi:uncharacterized protein
LRYKIKEITAEGRLCDQALPAALLGDALAGLEADLEASSGSLRVELSKLGDRVLARGAVHALVTLPCALCLKPARVRIDAPLQMTYVREGDPLEAGDGDPLADEELGHHDGDVVDLAPTVRELVILSIPLSPRCPLGDRCRGLCQVCGEDLNLRDCGHAPRVEGGAFATLKNLKL